MLSTIAPLALAGAVHLYILIARGPVKGSDREDLAQAGHVGQADRLEDIAVTRTDRIGQQQPQAGQVSAGQPVTALTDRLRLSLDRQTPSHRSLTGDSTPADSSNPVIGHHEQPPQAADLPGQSDTPPPVTGRDTRTPSDRRSDPDTEDLLKIARSAVRAEDKLTRKVVAQAIRGQQIPLSNDTLTALMAQLRKQHGQPVTSARN